MKVEITGLTPSKCIELISVLQGLIPKENIRQIEMSIFEVTKLKHHIQANYTTFNAPEQVTKIWGIPIQLLED